MDVIYLTFLTACSVSHTARSLDPQCHVLFAAQYPLLWRRFSPDYSYGSSYQKSCIIDAIPDEDWRRTCKTRGDSWWNAVQRLEGFYTLSNALSYLQTYLLYFFLQKEVRDLRVILYSFLFAASLVVNICKQTCSFLLFPVHYRRRLGTFKCYHNLKTVTIETSVCETKISETFWSISRTAAGVENM